MNARTYQDQWDAYFDKAVYAAADHAYRTCAFQEPHKVYLVLAEELRRRGIDPDPEAVFEGARLISQGRKPAVLERNL